METRKIYYFESFRVDPGDQKVWLGDAPISLTPKVFQTLVYLIENRDRILTKEELLAAIWPDRIVEEANLTQNISVLRKALGETTVGKKYIATFPGRGYRFLGLVNILPVHGSREKIEKVVVPSLTDNPATELRAQPRFSKRTLAMLAIAGAGILGLVFGWPYLASSIKSWRSDRSAETKLTLDRRTLTRLPGAEYQPVWSSNGKYLAFTHSERSGSPSSLYIQNLEHDLSPRLFMKGDGEYESPAWSPDGTELAFLHRTRTSTDVVIGQIATGQRRVVNNVFGKRYGLACRHLDWSPDGRFLVVNDKASEEDPLSLYLISLADQKKIRLTYPSMDIIGDVTPRFSPDGTQLAFIRIKYQFQYDVFTIPVVGGEAQRVTSDAKKVADVDWADNSHLVFCSNRRGGYRLWSADLEGAGQPAFQVLPGLDADVPIQFSIGRARGDIVYSEFQPDLNIWMLHLPVKSPDTAQWTRAVSSTGEDCMPSFSHDGKRICFWSDRLGQERLWVSDADGAHAKPITGVNLRPSFSGWSPRGEIVFSANFGDALFVAPSEAPSRVRKISSMTGGHPAFSSDGKSIYSHRNFYIYKTPVDGGEPTLITAQGGYPLVESRDGKYLYFTRGRMDTKIWRLDLATKALKIAVDGLLPGYWGAWALGGKGIFYLTNQEDTPWIYFRDFESHRDQPIAAFPSSLPPIGTSTFSLSPDEKKLLIVGADSVGADIKSYRTASVLAEK